MNIKYLTLLLTLTQLTFTWGERYKSYLPWSRHNQVIQQYGQQATTQKPIRPSFWSRTYNYIKNTPKRFCILYNCRSQWNKFLQNRKYADPSSTNFNLYKMTSENLVKCANLNCSRYMH